MRKAYDQGSLVIAAGTQFDVLVQGGQPGTTRLETLPDNTGPAGSSFPRVDLATVVSSGTPVSRAALPTDFAPHEDLSKATIAARKTVVHTENGPGTKFYINGRTYDPHRIGITSTLGTVEECPAASDDRPRRGPSPAPGTAQGCPYFRPLPWMRRSRIRGRKTALSGNLCRRGRRLER